MQGIFLHFWNFEENKRNWNVYVQLFACILSLTK